MVKSDCDAFFCETRTSKSLQISPFTEYLYLKPLYSTLGGSTTRAEPLTKKFVVVTLRLNPL